MPTIIAFKAVDDVAIREGRQPQGDSAPPTVTVVVLTPAFDRWISRRCAPCFPKPVSRRVCSSSTHEAPNELRNFIRRSIEREMAPVDDVHFGLWHIPAISFRLRGVEREFILAPDHQ